MEQITEKINDLFVSWGFDSSEVGPIMTCLLYTSPSPRDS